MKKVLLFSAAVLVAASTFTSCKKDYTCDCSGGTLTASSTPIKDAKKKDAQDACDALNVIAAIGGGTCTLK
jgi:hypothetical protein